MKPEDLEAVRNVNIIATDSDCDRHGDVLKGECMR